MKNLKFPTSKRFWIPLLVLVLVLQSILMGVIGYRVSILWLQHGINTANPVNDEIRQMILNANRSLYTDTPIDAEADRVYLPGIKIYLPLNQNTERLLYGYSLSDDGLSAEASLSTDQIMVSHLQNWSEIPCVQKFVGIGINGPSQNWEEFQPVHTLELADGRTMQIYANSDPACELIWGTILPGEIVESLKEANSY